MRSRSKMALPVQTNMKHLFRFIQKLTSPKRLFSAGACPENKVRTAVKMFLTVEFGVTARRSDFEPREFM